MTDTRIQEMQAKIDSLEQENLLLKQQVKTLQKQAFGRKTEKRAVVCPDDGMPSLFDEAETEAKQSVKEPEPVTLVKEHKRKKKTGTKVTDIMDSLPEDCIERVEADLNEEQKVCSKCGHSMHPLGKTLIRKEVKFIPAKLKLI